MKVPYPNAFSQNKLGLNAVPFPFGITSKRHDNRVMSLTIFPSSVIDLCEIIEKYAKKIITLFDIEQSIPEEPNLRQRAKKIGINYHDYNPNIISISKDSLKKLIDGFLHYELHLLDFQSELDENTMANIYKIWKSWNWKGSLPLLNNLNGPNIFLDSHDDCYQYLESYNLSFLKEIFIRTLQIYCGTLYFESNQVLLDVSNIPPSIINKIYPIDSSMTILHRNSYVNKEKVQIGYSNKKFDFTHDQIYDVNGYIYYDIENRKWAISKTDK